MSAVEALLIVLINLLFTSFLISYLYIVIIQPIQKRLESYGAASQRLPLSKRKDIVMETQAPSNILPDMDDIPMDIAYGEDEDPDYSTMDEVTNDLVDETKYNQLELEDDNAWKQLSKIKSNAEIARVHD